MCMNTSYVVLMIDYRLSSNGNIAYDMILNIVSLCLESHTIIELSNIFYCVCEMHFRMLIFQNLAIVKKQTDIN